MHHNQLNSDSNHFYTEKYWHFTVQLSPLGHKINHKKKLLNTEDKTNFPKHRRNTCDKLPGFGLLDLRGTFEDVVPGQ